MIPEHMRESPRVGIEVLHITPSLSLAAEHRFAIAVTYPVSVHPKCQPGVSWMVQSLRSVEAGQMMNGCRHLPLGEIHSRAVT
jgi:hypothetical protein